MFKDSSVEYYQIINKYFKKKLVKDIKLFLRKKKKKAITWSGTIQKST